MHVYVISGEGEAKFWLDPEIKLAKAYRYNPNRLKEIIRHPERFPNEAASG